MSSTGLVGRVAGIVAALVVAASGANADEWCDGEFESLKFRAAGFEIAAKSAPVIAAGEPIEVSWKGRIDSFPNYFSAWLVVVSIDDVRFEGAGFYPLPGGTPGPQGMEFAGNWTRAIVPLHAPDAPGAGTIRIKPYREGRFGLSWAIIARSECGERQLTETGTHVVEVEARHAEIVVQDLYDYSRPETVIHSRSGRYELRVFDGYYQVFDRRTGGKVIDRRGHCPDFSPTGRFVAALAGRSDGQCEFYTAGENKPKFEVVDLLTGDVVANPDPPALWAYGDAFLVVPSKWWKMLQGPGRVLSLLTDHETGAGSDNPPLVEVDDSSAVSIDIANGYVYRMYKSSGEPDAVFSLGGLGQISERQVAWDQEKNVAVNEGMPVAEILAHVSERSVAAPKPRSLADDDQVLISHRRYLTDPAEVFADAVEEEEVTALTGRSEDHPVVARGESTSIAGDPMLTASLLRGADVLASARRAGRTVEGLVGELLGISFVPQLDAANPVDRVTGRMWEIDKLDISDEEKRERLNAFRSETVFPIVDRLIDEISPAFHVLTLRLGCWPNGGAIYADNLSGIWRHEGGGRTAWLTHAGCMGIGTVGNLALNHVDLFIKDDSGARHFNLMFDRRFYCAGNDADCEYVEQSSDSGEEFTKKEQGFGSLSPAGNMKPDPFGAKISQDFQQLIEFDSLLPVFLDDRYLLLPIGRQMFVVDLEMETMAGPVRLAETAAGSRFSLSRDRRHLLQASASGGLAIHDFSSGEVVLNGRYVDDELVIYDRYGHYLSTHEGAQYVHMRFVGRPELYSLSRMADVLERPDIVRATLGNSKVAAPQLAAPPRLDAELLEADGTQIQEIAIEARSPSGLKSLRIHADGALVDIVSLEGEEFEGTIPIDKGSDADWLSLVAVDTNGFQSVPVEIRLSGDNAAARRLFVLAVGTDTYEDTDRLPALNFAVSDAENFVGAVTAVGRNRYDEVRVIGPFLDSASLSSELDAAIGELASDARPDDTVMVFVAGHGIRDAGSAFYLATRSTRLDDLPGTGLSWGSLAEGLARLKARTFVFLDACHSGSAGEATNDGAADALLSAADGSITVIAASKGRQYSLESASAGGGYFTGSIASIIKSADTGEFDNDGSRTLDLDELYLALKRRVVEATDGRQTPWIARSQVVGRTPLF